MENAYRQWWREARFGMFVHWGLYSQLARGEWVMNRDYIPREEYETLADTWRPRPGCIRGWAALARRAGMKYVVLTAKHHGGFYPWIEPRCCLRGDGGHEPRPPKGAA